MQSTKEGEPAAIENEAEWNKRRNLRRRRSRQSVGRQQWEYDEVGEEKEEEKISRRSIARLVKLHFSERCCVKERGRAKKAADRAFSRLVCHKRSSRWWSEQKKKKKKKKRKQWEKKLRRRRVVQPYDDDGSRVSDSGVVVVEKSIIEYRRPKKTARETQRESVKFFQ